MSNLNANEAFDLILDASGYGSTEQVLVVNADGDQDWTDAADLDPERLYLDLSERGSETTNGAGNWALVRAGSEDIRWERGELADIAETLPAGRWIVGS